MTMRTTTTADLGSPSASDIMGIDERKIFDDSPEEADLEFNLK